MTIRRHLVLLTTMLLLASCTQENEQESGRVVTLCLVSESTEIAQIGDVGETRAADGVNDKTTFSFPADFTVAMDGHNYVYVATALNTNMTSSSPACYPVNGSSVRLQAFYPSYKMQYSATPRTFTVEQNQCQTSLGTTNYQISDLMYGLPKEDFADIDGSGPTRRVKPTANSIPLVFEHMMVKIRLDVTINSGITVKGITMKNVQRSIDFNTADATFSHLATASDGLGDNVLMYDDATGITTNFTCTALIPQQDLAAGTPFIDVLIKDNPTDRTLTYKLHEAANFISGKQYIYTLEVNMDEVDGVSCEITNWNMSPAGWTDISDIVTL